MKHQDATPNATNRIIFVVVITGSISTPSADDVLAEHFVIINGCFVLQLFYAKCPLYFTMCA